MRVTKTIKGYIEKQLRERRETVLAPYRDEASDAWKIFLEEAGNIIKECEETAEKKLERLAASHGITNFDGAPVKAEVDSRAYGFYNVCEARLPAMMVYKTKRDEVNARFDEEKEELLVSLELDDMDKKSLLAAIADIKLEG